MVSSGVLVEGPPYMGQQHAQRVSGPSYDLYKYLLLLAGSASLDFDDFLVFASNSPQRDSRNIALLL